MQCEMCDLEADYRVHLSDNVKLHVCKRCRKKYPLAGFRVTERKKKDQSGATGLSESSGKDAATRAG